MCRPDDRGSAVGAWMAAVKCVHQTHQPAQRPLYDSNLGGQEPLVSESRLRCACGCRPSPAPAPSPAEPGLTSNFPPLRTTPPPGTVEPGAHPARQPGPPPAHNQPEHRNGPPEEPTDRHETSTLTRDAARGTAMKHQAQTKVTGQQKLILLRSDQHLRLCLHRKAGTAEPPPCTGGVWGMYWRQ